MKRYRAEGEHCERGISIPGWSRVEVKVDRPSTHSLHANGARTLAICGHVLPYCCSLPDSFTLSLIVSVLCGDHI